MAKQLQFFIRDEAGFFKRAPRHLILTERNRKPEALIQAVRDAWSKLPLAKITVGTFMLAR